MRRAWLVIGLAGTLGGCGGESRPPPGDSPDPTLGQPCATAETDCSSAEACINARCSSPFNRRWLLRVPRAGLPLNWTGTAQLFARAFLDGVQIGETDTAAKGNLYGTWPDQAIQVWLKPGLRTLKVQLLDQDRNSADVLFEHDWLLDAAALRSEQLFAGEPGVTAYLQLELDPQGDEAMPDLCNEANDACTGQELCSGNICEAAFPRRFDLTVDQLTIPAKDSRGDTWDTLSAGPDPYLVIKVNGSEIHRTQPAENDFSPSFVGAKVASTQLTSGDALTLSVLDSDSPDPDDLIGTCAITTLSAENARSRHLSCTGQMPISFTLTPRPR